MKDRLATPKLCANYAEDILSCFDVEVQENSEHKHLRSVYEACYRRLFKLKRRPDLD